MPKVPANCARLNYSKQNHRTGIIQRVLPVFFLPKRPSGCHKPEKSLLHKGEED